jgi:hypothetical protein
MAVGPDMRYYVHTSTRAGRAQQEYLRDLPKKDVGWWALVIVLAVFVVAALWFLGR